MAAPPTWIPNSNLAKSIGTLFNNMTQWDNTSQHNQHQLPSAN